MARTATPAPTSKEEPVDLELIAQDFSAANQLAIIQTEQQAATRAMALAMGYQLESTDPDLIQRDISANMRRSVEACLEVGKGLRVLKAATPTGEFMARLEALNIDYKVASKFMQSATKFSNVSTSRLLGSAGNQSKLFEMLVLDDEQIEELEIYGQTGELALDAVATMSVKELRGAVREARKSLDDEKTISGKKSDRIAAQQETIDRIAVLPPDEDLADLQAKASKKMSGALAAVRGELRQALLAIKDHSDADNSLFMAGMVGQVKVELNRLLEEFNLPDISTAAEQELAAEVAQWAN